MNCASTRRQLDGVALMVICRETRAPTGECWVVDASMELGGDGAEAHGSLHPAVLSTILERDAAREESPSGAAMVEVLCNVTPAAMVVDELRDSDAAKAAAAVGNHGVQLIATAHAETLAELVNNKAMAPVLGDFEECTLSDREAMRRSGAQRWGNFSKVRNQRIGEATFDAVVELRPPSCSRRARGASYWT